MFGRSPLVVPFQLARIALVALYVALAWLGGGVTAAAQWKMIEEPGQNGETSYSLLSQLDSDHVIGVLCQGASHQIALVDLDGRGPAIYEVDFPYVWLQIETDVGGMWNSPGDFVRYADGTLNLYYQNVDEMRAIVEGIAAAKSEITVTMIQAVSGTADSYKTSAKGSTAAARAFIDKCFGGAPGARPSPSAWAVTVEPDTVNGGQQATLVGDLDQGGYFYAYCDGRKRADVAFLSSNPSTFPYEAGDLGLTLQVEIDGEQRSAVGEYFVRPDGTSGIRYIAPEYLESLIAAVGAARSEVAMTIQSYSTGMVTRWPARSLEGVGKAVADFSAQCFGNAPARAN